jgi:hypothetical protein
MGIAKFDPPKSRTMAKLIPMTLPSLLKRGPPEPPDVVCAPGEELERLKPRIPLLEYSPHRLGKQKAIQTVAKC